MKSTRNIDELCKITGFDRKHIQRILDMGVKIGAFIKISDNDYEMTDMGLKVASKITIQNDKSVDPGTWTCSKCKTVNNALNGSKCIKCNYSYVDSLSSDVLKREPKEYKFPQITDREMFIFLIGHLTGICTGSLEPKEDVSFKEKLEYNSYAAKILARLTSKVLDQFPHITDDEFGEIMQQLNALQTMPFLDEAIKKMRNLYPDYKMPEILEGSVRSVMWTKTKGH